MPGKLIYTEHWEEFKEYYKKAAALQEINIAAPLGRDTSEPLHVNDPLQHHITIYDTVDRCFAGFANAIQQVWYGSENPKQWQVDKRCDGLQESLGLEEWLWLFLFHRLTGSGASFSHDHGFRNSVLLEIALENKTIDEMRDHALRIMATGKPIFTSIGNTIPMFPKPVAPYEKASAYYIGHFMNPLVRDVARYVREHPLELSIREGVDLINTWHRANGLKCFHFQMTAFVMDIAEYFPEYIDPYSQVNYGKNAVEALSIIFKGEGFKSKDEFLDAAMDRIVEEFRSPYGTSDMEKGMGKAMCLEDVACDYIRYVGSYVPKGYEHLELWRVTHNPVTGIQYPKHWTWEKHAELKKKEEADGI